MPWRIGLALFTALSAFARSGMAEQPPGDMTAPAPENEGRQGIYGSFTLGYGWLYMVVDGHDETGASLSASGLSSSNDLLLGHSLAPGLALGGALSGTGTFSFALDAERRPARDTDTDYFVIGPFVDWYPKATAGLHLGAALGFAWVRPSMAPNPGTTETLGGGASVWGGYDWSSKRGEASLGLIGKISSTLTFGYGYGASITVGSAAFTLLATLTYF